MEGSASPSRLQAKCASKAVRFVIQHSQKGIVSLCTDIAAIMEERDSLAKENKGLKQKLEAAGSATTRKREDANFQPASTQTENVQQLCIAKKRNPTQDSHNTTDVTASNQLSSSMLLSCLQSNRTFNMLNVLHSLAEVVKSWLPLEDCLCERCKRLSGPKACPKTLTLNVLERGCRAVVKNQWLGRVRYVGHLDCSAACGIWVGVELEEPLGFTDGSLGGKAYFSCKPRCGLFAIVSSVTYVASWSEGEKVQNHTSYKNHIYWPLF